LCRNFGDVGLAARIQHLRIDCCDCERGLLQRLFAKLCRDDDYGISGVGVGLVGRRLRGSLCVGDGPHQQASVQARRGKHYGF
jgi:hypothetical protein